ncbi:MAG: ABC transporter ATP-binding protein [Inquilinaceae bacterium]
MSAPPFPPLEDGAAGRRDIVLALSGITRRFGPVLANDGIDLDLGRGEILALLGENGAGKTTLMNILFGHYVADAGTVRMAPRGGGPLRALEPGSPQAALDAGIGMVHQHFALAENLTALDAITLGTEPLWRPWRSRRAARRRVEALMDDSGLTVDLDTPVGGLAVGEQQRVEILKTLYRDVRVLVLDEPTAVLTPQEADGLFATLRRLAAGGLGIVFISHKLGEVLAVSDRIAVLRGGRKAGEMTTASADRRAIAEMMVGRDVPVSRRTARPQGETLLSLADVTLTAAGGRPLLRAASLTVREGEIVGIAGVSGNGQAGLAALAAGLSVPDAGTLELFGQAVRRPDPQSVARAGVARVPEDRHRDGIVGAMSVAENLVLETVRDPAVSRVGFLRFPAIRRGAETAIRAYDIRCPGPDAPARLLSGGNIQKLVLARGLDRSPRLILANQPTRGLDLGAQSEIHARLLDARMRGAGVLLISEDLDELLTLADRVVAIHDGRLIDAGATDALDRARLGLMMAGHGDDAKGVAA